MIETKIARFITFSIVSKRQVIAELVHNFKFNKRALSPSREQVHGSLNARVIGMQVKPTHGYTSS